MESVTRGVHGDVMLKVMHKIFWYASECGIKKSASIFHFYCKIFSHQEISEKMWSSQGNLNFYLAFSWCIFLQITPLAHDKY